ncbi:MAG: DUF2254 family protein [Pseudomonadota bacterium]
MSDLGQSAGSLATRLSTLVQRAVPSPVLRLFEGYLLVPLMLALLGGALALALPFLEAKPLLETLGIPRVAIDISGARMTLSVIASGVLTIASLVFSLTFVALSITSQQLSPRILDYVLHERATQILLGVAFGTFIFATLSLAVGDTSGTWQLVLAVAVASVLAIVTLIAVVVFSHRMTRVMRAEDMVSRLGDQFMTAVRREVPSTGADTTETVSALASALKDGAPVAATGTGYLGTVDYAALVDLAASRNLLIEVLIRENSFVLQGEVVARLAGAHGEADAHADAITRALNLTDRRSIGATPRYEGSSLCEAALKALSPGINDPATARSCVNRLFQGAVFMAEARSPVRHISDADDVARVLRQPYDLQTLIGEALLPVVEAVRDRATLDHLQDLAVELRSRTTMLEDIEAADLLISEIEAAQA